MPKTPPLVLKVQGKEPSIINSIIQTLSNSGFLIRMFPATIPDQFYIALHLKQERLEAEAKAMKLKIKLNDIDAKVVFEPGQRVKFEPFRTKDLQKVMMTLINNILNTEQLMTQKIILDILVMHDFQGINEL